MSDVVAEARAIRSTKQTKKLITDATKGIDEEVYWTILKHSQMKLRRKLGPFFFGAVTGAVHICGEYILPKETHAPTVVVMITLPEFAWKTASIKVPGTD